MMVFIRIYKRTKALYKIYKNEYYSTEIKSQVKLMNEECFKICDSILITQSLRTIR